MSKKTRTLMIVVMLIVIAVVIFYKDLVHTFWTQDEWWELGRAVDARTQGVDYYFRPWGGHVVPLMLFFLNLQFWVFGMMNIVPYALLAIFGHALIAVIFMLLVYRVSKNILLGAISGFVFAINTAPFQAVTWLSGGVTHIQGATFFFLLSLVAFALYIKNSYRIRYFILSLALIIIALNFTEYVMFYFVFIPICCLAFMGKRSRWLVARDIVLVMLMGVLFAGYYLTAQKVNVYGKNFIGVRVNEQKNLEKPQSPLVNYFKNALLNTKKLMPRVPSQVWLNEPTMHKLSGRFKNFSEFSYSIFFLWLAVVIYIAFSNRRNKMLFRMSLIAALLTILGAFPAYAFPSFPDIIDSKYLYLASLGFSLTVGLFLISIGKHLSLFFKDTQVHQRAYLVVGILILGPLTWNNYSHIHNRLEDTVLVSKMRKQFLAQTMKYHPYLMPKTVFYATTNLGNGRVPWPVSLPYTLLVTYTYNTGYNGLPFFRANTILTVDQGYEEQGELGLGVFYQLMPLIETLKKYNLTEDNVYAIHWQATPDSLRNLDLTHTFPPVYDGMLLDKTQEIRKALRSIMSSDNYAQAMDKLKRYFSGDFKLVFNRNTEATFVNSNGNLESALIGFPRITNDGLGKAQGILIESKGWNLLLWSQDLSQKPWEHTTDAIILRETVTAPDGRSSATGIEFKSNSASISQAVGYRITKPDAIDYTFSIFLRSPVKNNIDLVLKDDAGKVYNKTVIVGPQWRRFDMSLAMIQGGPLTVALTNTRGKIYAWGAQLEENSYASSYIPSKDTMAFRGDDSLIASCIDTYALTQGAISMWVKLEWNSRDKEKHYLFFNGEAPNRNSITLEANSQYLRFCVMDDNLQYKYLDHYWDVDKLNNNGWNHIVATWGQGDLIVYINGKQVSVNLGGTGGSGKPKDGMYLNYWPNRIGCDPWYRNQADAIISRFKIIGRPLDAGEVLGLYETQRNDYGSSTNE